MIKIGVIFLQLVVVVPTFRNSERVPIPAGKSQFINFIIDLKALTAI